MIYETISLPDHFPMLGTKGGTPVLQAYVRDTYEEIDPHRVYPTVVICPGGGYEFVSPREGEAVALAYLNEGFNAFVLTYCVAPAIYPAQLLQLSAAISYIRANAARYHANSSQIAVCGFSAGGHLAASLCCLWDSPFIAETLRIPKESNRPQAGVLCYPVITSGEFAHRGSFESLCGGNQELEQKLSLERAVSENTPPLFLWHTADDGAVPVENSLLMAAAMRKNNRPFELHVYQSGPHGLSLCNEETAGDASHVKPLDATWHGLSVGWLKSLFQIE